MPRVNITISDELKEYFEDLSKETGASQSALMCIALKEYVEQKKALSNMSNILDQMKQFEKLKDSFSFQGEKNI